MEFYVGDNEPAKRVIVAMFDAEQAANMAPNLAANVFSAWSKAKMVAMTCMIIVSYSNIIIECTKH